MDNRLYSDQFSKVLDRLIKKGGISCYSISTYTGIDQGYLSRLRHGKKQSPTPAMLVKISIALAHLSQLITIDDIETLFNATGRTISPRYWNDHGV